MPGWLYIALMVSGFGLVIVAVLSAILHFFIGLKLTPAKRAGLTVAIAYVMAIALLYWFGPQEYRLYFPAVPIPGAIIAFLFWWHDFRGKWVAATDVGEVKLASDDWRVGLLSLLVLLTIGAGIVLYRMIVKGMFASVA